MVGGAIALACTVGGPILVGMAVGAATGTAYGGLLGGVSSHISGGEFMNGFSCRGKCFELGVTSSGRCKHR